MIKECKVISYNKYQNILVFEHDGMTIQTTATLSEDDKVVYVNKENNKYNLVSKQDYNKQVANKKKIERGAKNEKIVKNDQSDV